MEYKEFLSKVMAIMPRDVHKHPIEIVESLYNIERYKGKLEEDYIYVKWLSGGQTGGSCWDEDEPKFYKVNGEEEPRFDSLSTLIDELTPDLSYKDFSRIEEKMQKGNYQEYEYYGNYSIYSYKKLRLMDIYEVVRDVL